MDLHVSSPLGSNVDLDCVRDQQVGRKMQKVRQLVRLWKGYGRRGCQLRGLVTTMMETKSVGQAEARAGTRRRKVEEVC